MTTLETGSTAPAFTLATNGGGSVKLADLKGRKVVVYFYPKDDTSGCTTEARDFTALIADFEKADTVVIGISRDSVAAHDKFVKKHELAVILAADEEGTTTEAYGVWVEKSMYGKKYMGIERATYLIDTRGKIARIWRKVKVSGHAAQVLEAAQAL